MNHDHVLVYATNKDVWRPFRLQLHCGDEMSAIEIRTTIQRGPWKATPLYAQRIGSAEGEGILYSLQERTSYGLRREERSSEHSEQTN